MVEVVQVENRSLRRPKDELFGDVILTLQVRLQQTFVSQFDEESPQLAGQVHPPRFLALRRRVLATHIIVLHQDETLGSFVIVTELDVAPLDRHEFSASQPGAHCHQQ